MSNVVDRPLNFTHEQQPGRVVFGPGRRREVADEVARFDPRSVVVVAGAHEVATVDDTRHALAQPVEAIIGVRPHVPSHDVRAALEVVDRHEADVIVTIGGGSATGLGKMIALHREVTLASLPTTYAGSEMTPIWGSTEDGVKTTGRSPRVLPATVIYDPELTVGLPISVSVASAFNAIAHCVEALWLPDTSPISAEAAVGAVGSILAGVTAVAAEPDDINARSELLYGAHRAGTVLAVAGTGLLHQTAHVLGGMFDLDHGALYAVLTPIMVRYHLEATPEAEAALVAALGSGPAEALTQLATDLGAPRTLSDIGVPSTRIDDAIDAVARHTGVAVETIGPLLRHALAP